MEHIEITKLHAGYKLTVYPQRSLVLTAQDLREISAWCQAHRSEIEDLATNYYDCKECGQTHPKTMPVCPALLERD